MFPSKLIETQNVPFRCFTCYLCLRHVGEE